MDEIFQELGIPRRYVRNTCRDNRYVSLVHRIWLKSLIKHSKLTDFIERSSFESWPDSEEEIGPCWMKIMIQVFKKKEEKVLPLPKMRPKLTDEPHLGFCQLLQYISQTNYKNIWKESYKKYNNEPEASKDIQVVLIDYNEALTEAITRIYGCPFINLCEPKRSTGCSKQFQVHLNILPAICALETPNAFFLIHIPFMEHTLNDCVTFSPTVLEKCYKKPLFIVYQLLRTVKSLHDRSVTLGEVTLSDIYINDDLWIQVFPQPTSNIFIQDIPKMELKKATNVFDCHKHGHKFNSALKCDNCGVKTYDRYQVTNENLEKLCQLWVEGHISNYTYLTALNNLAGRKVGDPNCHHVFPWVTDFSARCGKNWRDLRKSKYRLNKGDRQLDLQYENCQTKVRHHVSDVLSAITYYVYMARRTPKSVLCKHVRTVWVPAEYPVSIQRLQEWTPDECIPEFFTDPSVFKSIHDDLDDLEVPAWSSSPEDFVDKHREALESTHVSERLHHWIDLTFGYKLTGHAAVKSKNVCLQLVDEHETLTKSGVVQLFTQPHPPRVTNSIFWSKFPPKIFTQKSTKNKTRDRSLSSTRVGDKAKSDDEIEIEQNQPSTRSPLVLSNFLSRSRNCLNEDSQKVSRNPNRSSSLGPKTATFTSHVSSKPKSSQPSVPSTNPTPYNPNSTIFLPKEYKPEAVLESLEKLHGFFSKTFHIEQSRKFGEIESNESGKVEVQNAFTNRIFTENFERKLAKKSYTVDNQIGTAHRSSCTAIVRRPENQITCNYAEIITSRCTREIQMLGCLLVEIFMNKQLRTLESWDINKCTYKQRLKACVTIARTYQNDIPSCIKYIVNYLLCADNIDSEDFKYPCVTDLGLPSPTPHLLLEPLLYMTIPFSCHFLNLWSLISASKAFEAVTQELNVRYHQECNGETCNEYESMERTKLLLAQNIGECKVKLCAKNLEILTNELSIVTDSEIISILLPHVKNLIEEPSTSVLASWYLFDPIAKLLGPTVTTEKLLQPIIKLYENEFNETTAFFNNKIVKLYHHHFLLCLIVRLGLKCFLENFITPLVEAVGGYRDYEQIEFVFHTHTTKIIRKTSNLKSMAKEQNDISLSDDSSTDSELNTVIARAKKEQPEEVFEFEEDQMKSLIAHLELNAESELPFDHSTAEEALDATLSENIDQLRNLEELNLDIDEQETNFSARLMSPTIPIPSHKPEELCNISCDVGSKKSDNECFVDQHSNPSHFDMDFETKNLASSNTSGGSTKKINKYDAKISDMSADSLIWLSHRLGPVLTARYLTRNLLKMLTLCYVGKENLAIDNNQNADLISIANGGVIGDQNALNVLECLSNIAALYGEQLILVQYLSHMSELISLCKRKLTQNLEGGLISCLALLKYTVPFISDSALMDQLQDIILKNILNPMARLLGSTKYIFPNGATARNVIARKYLDTVYLLTLRIGADMTRLHLAVPALQRFFLIFDKITTGSEDFWSQKEDELARSLEESHYVELRRDGTTTEWAIGGRPVQISHVRLKDSESVDSLSPPPLRETAESFEKDTVINQALEELKAVFTAELAHQAYVPFLKQIGLSAMEASLKNHAHIQILCQEHEQVIKSTTLSEKSSDSKGILNASSSIGSNIALIGNRIDVQSEDDDSHATNVLKLVSNRMENESRHLRGNWLAYWEHEIGRSDKDVRFNFKQIKLQTFSGHTHSVKSLYVLDNENSFMSGSRDKTVKLWSLRSQGDGNAVSTCQWTYTAHRKSILAITFIESLRLAASCDSIVHIWDPFLGVNVCSLESPKYAPVNILKSMPAPSTQMFAGTTDGTVKVVDGRLCNYVHELKLTLSPGGLIRCIAVSPSGNWMATGQSSGQITILDTRTGLVISTWCAHEGEVLQLIAVNENTLISSSLDQTVAVWNVQDGKFKFNMRGASEPVHCLNIYNTELISGTTANRIGVHTSIDRNASFSSTKLRSDAFKGLLTSMALLPLNRLLLLGADNGNVVLLC